jgi:hypothetical protein
MTAGIRPRATALLTRQALEADLDDFWRRRAPGVENCSARAQMLCLPSHLSGNPDLASRVSHAWSALSAACHSHPGGMRRRNFSRRVGLGCRVGRITAGQKMAIPA